MNTKAKPDSDKIAELRKLTHAIVETTKRGTSSSSEKTAARKVLTTLLGRKPMDVEIMAVL